MIVRKINRKMETKRENQIEARALCVCVFVCSCVFMQSITPCEYTLKCTQAPLPQPGIFDYISKFVHVRDMLRITSL